MYMENSKLMLSIILHLEMERTGNGSDKLEENQNWITYTSRDEEF